MNDRTPAARLGFPLRGTWTALNSPADRVPSHGTEYFAQKFAIDFIRVDEEKRLPYTGPAWRHLLLALDASEFLCWDEPVLAAEGGRVVHAGDGWFDRRRVNLVYELVRCTFAPPLPRRGDNRPLAGNHVIVEGPSGCTVYAHLRNGSVRVKQGDAVSAGDPVGTVGNSGNTTMPHLHFQLMDRPDPTKAKGLPFAFTGLKVLRDGGWQPLEGGVPAAEELVRA
jgi:hypothetical protein